MLEGMQTALFTAIDLPESTMPHQGIAYTNLHLAFSGKRISGVLTGRTICTTFCLFAAARITSFEYAPQKTTLFGVPRCLQVVFSTGLLGALVITMIASLTSQIFALSFPVIFLSNPLLYLVIRLCLLMEASGLFSAAWIAGRWQRLLFNFQPDSVYLEGRHPFFKAPVTRRDKEIDIAVTVIKYLYSMALLVFCLAIVTDAVLSKQTILSKNANPTLAFLLFWGLLIWLGVMEGGQGCLIGLQPVNEDLFKKSHPVAWKCTNLAHRDDNIERIIVGRQFWVVLVVSVINLCIKATANASILGLSQELSEVFVTSGVASVFCTVIISQLTAQVNAANCMLDFINTRLMLMTVYVSLAIEYSGLLHSVYLVQILFSKIAGQANGSNDPRRDKTHEIFFWVRLGLSVFILAFAFAVTLTALIKNSTEMWNGVPVYVSIILFFLLLCFMGMLQGLQIAFFTVVNLPKESLNDAPTAKYNCELAFSGRNLQTFLIGRQLGVTLCMFIVANMTTVRLKPGQKNLFGVSDRMENLLFNTGFLGALITTVVGCLSWRIFAAAFPIVFLSNPIVSVLLRICWTLEASGVCSAAWLLAQIHKEIAGYQLDEFYIDNSGEHTTAAENHDGDAAILDDDGTDRDMEAAYSEDDGAKENMYTDVWNIVQNVLWDIDLEEFADEIKAANARIKLGDFEWDIELEEGTDRP